MDERERVRDALEKACSLYPAERARMERAAESALALGSPLMDRALEKALARIFEARTPAEAQKQIDSMERVLVTSPGFAMLRKADAPLRSGMRRAAAVFAALAVVAFAVGLVATLLE